MLFSLALALLVVASNAYNPEVVLAKWNPRYRYALNKICERAQNSAFESNQGEDCDPTSPYSCPSGASRKQWREVRQCCNKDSHYEKKECLKDVRRNILDNQCDQGLKHACCKNQYETRYVCFARNPLNLDDYDSGSKTCALTGTCSAGSSRRRAALARFLSQTLLFHPEVSAVLESSYDADDSDNDAAANSRFSPLDDDAAADYYFNADDDQNDEDDAMNGQNYYSTSSRRNQNRSWSAAYDDETSYNECNGQAWCSNDDSENYYGKVNSASQTLRDLLNDDDNVNNVNNNDNDDEQCCNDNSCSCGRNCNDDGAPCPQSRRCRNQVRVSTNQASKQVCQASYSGASPAQQTSQCCRAGHFVGKFAGKRHAEVCRYAQRKFEEKSNQCLNNPYECKRAFRSCCHVGAQKAREQCAAEKTRNTYESAADETYTNGQFEYKRNPFVFF